MVCYYGCYSNVARGKRKKADADDVFPVYDDPPGPIADDYIIDSDYPAKVYF